MDQILQWFEANAGKIIFLLVAIVAALLITKGLARVMRKVLDRTDMPSASIFINIMRVLVWILAASIVLQPVFGISPTTLMTALGVGGIAVSLGLKDTVANVISGFGLMLGKVIQPGDLVSVAGTAGVVKDITWRQTVVRERNGNEMVIPNSVLNTASLEKLTPSNEGCVTMTFTAKAGSDPAHVTEAVKRAGHGHRRIRATRQRTTRQAHRFFAVRHRGAGAGVHARRRVPVHHARRHGPRDSWMRVRGAARRGRRIGVAARSDLRANPGTTAPTHAPCSVTLCGSRHAERAHRVTHTPRTLKNKASHEPSRCASARRVTRPAQRDALMTH